MRDAMDFQVLEDMPDAVIVVASDGTIRFINRVGEVLFGYERAEVAGQQIELLIPARFRGSHILQRLEYTSAPRRRPMGLRMDLSALTKEGREVPVEISLAPIQVNQETLTIAAVRDVTERKLLEERARQAEKAREEVRQRDEVLAVASHELRGPVSTVQLQVTALQRAAVEAIQDLTAMAERLAKIERNARHLARLVEELLDVRSRGSIQLKVEQLDLAELARENAERLREEVERSGSHLTLNVSGPVLGVWDAVRLEQVLTNLVVNATKCGQGKPIAVSIDANDDWARVTVADQGVGIAAEDQERIFGEFQRVESIAESVPGLGLGLFIVSRLVRAHGGRVLVRSSLGEGVAPGLRRRSGVDLLPEQMDSVPHRRQMEATSVAWPRQTLRPARPWTDHQNGTGCVAHDSLRRGPEQRLLETHSPGSPKDDQVVPVLSCDAFDLFHGITVP
jgi:protein-histidine pros-kinase